VRRNSSICASVSVAAVTGGAACAACAPIGRDGASTHDATAIQT
jgi:hypothetical protein